VSYGSQFLTLPGQAFPRALRAEDECAGSLAPVPVAVAIEGRGAVRGIDVRIFLSSLSQACRRAFCTSGLALPDHQGRKREVPPLRCGLPDRQMHPLPCVVLSGSHERPGSAGPSNKQEKTMKSIKSVFTAAAAVNYGLGTFWVLVTVLVLMQDAQRCEKRPRKDKRPAPAQSAPQPRRHSGPRPS
jgi:hypothetical protein